MKIFLAIVFIGLSGLSSLASASERTIGTLEGMVVNIYDGDNIMLNAGGTQLYVQLYGIDAPQMPRMAKASGWQRKRGQPFAREAFIALANKVLHKKVKMEILQILPYQHAPYQQALAVLWLEGRNINVEMVAEGWAWAAQRIDPLYAASYRHAQRNARIHKRGLWMQDNPEPPWEFRKKMEAATNPPP